MKKTTGLLFLFVLLADPGRADRLFSSGFETNNTTGTEWTAVVASPAIVTSGTTSPHSGTYSLEITAAAAAESVRRDTSASVTSGTYFFRFYFKYSSITTSDMIIGFSESSGGVNSWEAHAFDSAGNRRFRLRNVPTATNSDCAGNLASGTWYRVEVRWIISDTVGEVEMRTYTGDSTSADCTVQIGAVNTDTLGTNFNRYYLGSDVAGTTMTAYYDDIALNVSTGGFQTSWAGPGKIALVVPASNDTTAWTATGAGCTGNGNYDCVNDEPGTPDGDTTYNNSTTTNTDRFNITTLSGPDSDDDIILMHIFGMIGGTTTTGASTTRLVIWNSGGTAQNATAVAWCDRAGYPTTTIALLSWMLAYDTGTDNKATVETYDIGYQAVTNTQTCHASSVWANVEWIDAAAPPACSTFIALTGVGCK